jgi:hypothetical protein
MTLNEIKAVEQFLGSEMTDEQAMKLMDEARQLSIADREELLMDCSGPLYTEMSMHDAEMGGLGRY